MNAVERIVSDVIEYLGNEKEKFILIEDFPVILTHIINEKYGDGKFSYNSEIGKVIKEGLRAHEKIEIFRSGIVFNANGAFCHSEGDYFVLKGYYKDVAAMKSKHKIEPFFFKRRQDVIDWEKGELNIF